MDITQKTKITDGGRLGRASLFSRSVINLITGGFALACLIPFVFTVIISFSAEESIRRNGYSFFPSEWSVAAYKSAFEIGDQLWRSLYNSVLVTIAGTVLAVLICILYSYALFRRDYKFRGFFAFFCFFTMLFGGGLAPTVIITQTLLGQDNYAVLIIPMLVNVFNFIIMRSFFQASVPFELIEAAHIDGSGEWRTLFKIVLPISTPGIATVSLLFMLAYWNEWFIPQLYINNNNYVPLQYLLVQMQRDAQYMALNAGKAGSGIMASIPTESLRMALCVMIVVPISFAYPFFQRYIVKGLTVGSLKG
ncbi:MAG: carbohydrate ABC transporter permease [Oscillospiraceae bacterium]|nr:carbohydrate ABC transporter permease [Oscillospiraceae bacterium]